jgi:FAD/FMN-containing dehydrogenase
VVVHPESTEDVAKIVKIAVKYKMPITPYSAGSSLEGNCRAVRVTSLFLVLCDRWTVIFSTQPAGYV